MMKNLMLLLLLASCSKPEPKTTLSFSAAYVTAICMSQEPYDVVMVFDEMTVIIPVKEVNMGVVSITPVEVNEGRYELKDVYTRNANGDILSYYEHGFHESGIVVICILKGGMYYLTGDKTVYGQLFCDDFWQK